MFSNIYTILIIKDSGGTFFYKINCPATTPHLLNHGISGKPLYGYDFLQCSSGLSTQDVDRLQFIYQFHPPKLQYKCM